MITVTIPRVPRVVRISGGTKEQRDLHGSSLSQYFKAPIVWVEADATCTYEEATEAMFKEHAAVAERAYQGADSMWAF